MKFTESILKNFYEATKNVELGVYVDTWEGGAQVTTVYIPAGKNYSSEAKAKVVKAVAAIVHYNGLDTYDQSRSGEGILYTQKNGDLFLAGVGHDNTVNEIYDMSLLANYAASYDEFKSVLDSGQPIEVAVQSLPASSNTPGSNGTFWEKNKAVIIIGVAVLITGIAYLLKKRPAVLAA